MIDQLILDSCDPDQSVVVEACAGSGKTWLLVSRIIRLLLAGAKPSEILAITFTRKAAQEMRGRLDQVLLQFAKWDLARAITNNYFAQRNTWNKAFHLASFILKK